MNIDIIKAAISNPDLITNEMIHEVRGNCFHRVKDWTHSAKFIYPRRQDIWTCKCGIEVNIQPYNNMVELPNYLTDPREWWPLAWELIEGAHDVVLYCWAGDENELGIADDFGTIDIHNKSPGRAVCLAWLIMKIANGEIK